MYKFNFILYLIMACLSGAAMLCVPCAPLAICSSACFFCSGLPAFVAIIMTGIRMLGDNGDACAANDTQYDTAEGLSFAGDAELMRKLWITQMVFHIPLVCFMACGLQASIIGMAMFGAASSDGFMKQ